MRILQQTKYQPLKKEEKVEEVVVVVMGEEKEKNISQVKHKRKGMLQRQQKRKLICNMLNLN